ncbi:MAG: NAD(P)/FAD-dependent oxidoreductase [Candidatus Marsarchaeota archaeon]|nr:NAD(P)/FAD-dependent oxidoreductase [Candidatus Marsarchaeota archaeon]
MEEYDIIVAGSGVAGSLAAAVAAKSGLNVLLIDKNKPTEPGKKTNWGWVCGDAVAKSHLDFVSSRIGLSFDAPELDLKVDGVVAYSPDMQSKFPFDGEGFILDRPEFVRKLNAYALKNGAHYISEFDIEVPIIKDNYVVGVSGKDKNKENRSYNAKIVIDALGISTNLRRKLPDNSYIDKTIDIDDLESTGRYIYDAEIEGNDSTYYDQKYAIIHLNQELAPGGYGWVFPKSKKGRVNIGLGVQQRSLKIRNEKLNKNNSLQSLMDEYVKYIHVIKNPTLYNKDNNGKGIWSVSVRRQLECLVYNGYIGAGDSMAMPNPISAGGIGPALVAGILAGENAIRAVNDRDYSMKNLWKYNLDFNNEYGNKTAGMEVFRIYLQSLNNDIINYGFKNFLSEQEAVDLTYGRIPELSLATKFKMILKGASNINAFANLKYAVDEMKFFNELYKQYPKSPGEFVEWKHKVLSEMEKVKKRFKPNPI